MDNVLLGGLSSSLATIFTNPLEVRFQNGKENCVKIGNFLPGH